MNKQPTVHVICGFIGAGKTTFARTLEVETGAVRITKDEWLIRLIGNNPTVPGFAEYDARICALSQDIAFQFVKKGADVILDEGFWARDEREALVRRIENSGANAVLYFLDTPLETIRSRVAARNLESRQDSFTITRDMLDGYLDHWQPPGDDEDYILVTHL